MIRVVWGITQWGSATPSVVTVTATEAWAYPVGAQPVTGHVYVVRPILAWSGHSETPS